MSNFKRSSIRRYALFGARAMWSRRLVDKIGHPELLVTSAADDHERLEVIAGEVFSHEQLRAGTLQSLQEQEAFGIDIERLASAEQLFLCMIGRVHTDLTLHAKKGLFRQYVGFWKERFKKISLVIFQKTPHEGYDFVAYSVARMLKIETVCTYHMPVLPHLSTLIYAYTDLKRHAETALKTASPSAADHSKQGELRKRAFRSIRAWKSAAESDAYNSFTRADARVRNDLSFRVSKLVRWPSRGPRKTLSRQPERTCTLDQLTESKYFYFPLHYQPECSSMPLAGEYHQQALICSLLSKFLPEGYTLVLKEHPRASRPEWRGEEFYAQLDKLENVRWISTDVSSREILKSAAAAVTATGTIAWEAILLRKPVLLFGSRIFEGAPGAYPIEEEDELRRAIHAVIKVVGSQDEREYEKYLENLSGFLMPGVLSPKDLERSECDDEETAEFWSETVSRYVAG